jgi:hypothetical protein
VLVGHLGSKPVDVGTLAVEAEVAEHVVERPVLHHEDDDVLDLVESGDGLVHVDFDEAGPLRTSTKQTPHDREDASADAADAREDSREGGNEPANHYGARNGVEASTTASGSLLPTDVRRSYEGASR